MTNTSPRRDPMWSRELWTDAYDPGELLGFRKSGQPIWSIGGGAEVNLDKWVPEEYDSNVIQRVNRVSVVEATASRIPMGSNIKSVPRSAGLQVDYTTKGTAYGEDVTTADEVVLTARKFTRAIRIAEEDIADSLVNIIATKQVDWATSYAKAIDNACLAVTATVGTGVPFNSVYYALTQSNAATGYAANTNMTQSGSGTPKYADLNNSLKKLEVGDYFDDSRCICVAHPSFRGGLRGILDSQNRPIFIEYNTPDIQNQATLFGMPLRYSLGAKTSGVATSNPAGNPLLIFMNADYLLLGIRSGPESAFAPADSGVGFLTDDALLKMRSRRGFGVGNEFAFSVYENSSGL